MATGTITLTQNSTAVTGNGTTFTTELAVGAVIFVALGGVNYTLVVSAIASNTSLTLASAFIGNTTSGAAWTAIPRAALIGIHAQLAADTAWSRRASILDKQTWQNVFSSSGAITVTLPDGSSFTGPAWGSIATTLSTITSELSNKASKGANSDITSLSALTTALSISQGGTGATSSVDALKKLGIVGTDGLIPVSLGGTGAGSASGAREKLSAASSGSNSDITSITGVKAPSVGSNSRPTNGFHASIDIGAIYGSVIKGFNQTVFSSNWNMGTSFGTYVAASGLADDSGPTIVFSNGSGYTKYWHHIAGTGVIQTPSGNITPAVSDIRVKNQKKVITEDEAVNFIQGWESIFYTLKWSPDKLRIGFRAQDIFDKNPDLIDRAPLSDGDGGVIDDGMVVDVAEVASGYLVPVVQKLLREVSELREEINALKAEVKELKESSGKA